MTEEKQMSEEEMKAKQEDFDVRVKELHGALKAVAEKHGVAIVTAIYFKEEDLSGVHSYGKPNHIEEMGLAKLMEQKFIA